MFRKLRDLIGQKDHVIAVQPPLEKSYKLIFPLFPICENI